MEKASFEQASRRIDERNVDSFLCAIEPGFAKTLSRLPGASRVASTPRVEISETSDVYEFVFELAGVDQSGIDVTVTADMLSLRAERRVATATGRKWHHRELSPASLERTILLPEGLHTEDVAMKLENGLLTVRISKGGRRRARPNRLHS